MLDFLDNLWDWIKSGLKTLFKLTAKHVAREVLDILNDAELQHLAYDAVEAAADNGLKGNDAFDAALHGLTTKLRSQGQELKTSVKETLIQNAYIVFKHTPKE